MCKSIILNLKNFIIFTIKKCIGPIPYLGCFNNYSSCNKMLTYFTILLSKYLTIHRTVILPMQIDDKNEIIILKIDFLKLYGFFCLFDYQFSAAVFA